MEVFQPLSKFRDFIMIIIILKLNTILKANINRIACMVKKNIFIHGHWSNPKANNK